MSSTDKPRELNVTIVSPYFFPLQGGVENNALNMAVQTAKLGHKVTAFTSDRRRGQKLSRKYEQYEGVTIRRLRRALFKQYYLTFLPTLPWHLLRNDADVIHTHVPGMMWTEFSLILKKIFSKGTVFINTPHDPFMSRNKYSRFESILRNIYLPFLRLYYNWLYDYVIAVNPNQETWITKDYGVKKEKIVYVLNGLNPEMFEQIPIDPNFRKQYNITEDDVLITKVARYHEYKGYQNILQAINQIKNKKQLRIRFFGIGNDSGMLARLRNYIADNGLQDYVTLLESPNDSVRDQLLQLSQIFILASRSEAFGIAIAEAMAKYNAIISTTTEGGKFLIKDENGLLYDFSDVDQLAAHIRKLAGDKKLREEMAQHNYKYAQQFVWAKTFKPYAKLLGEISTSI